MKRKVLERDAKTGLMVERYADCGPSRAVAGHGRPMKTSTTALGGGAMQRRLAGGGGGERS